MDVRERAPATCPLHVAEAIGVDNYRTVLADVRELDPAVARRVRPRPLPRAPLPPRHARRCSSSSRRSPALSSLGAGPLRAVQPQRPRGASTAAGSYHGRHRVRASPRGDPRAAPRARPRLDRQPAQLLADEAVADQPADRLGLHLGLRAALSARRDLARRPDRRCSRSREPSPRSQAMPGSRGATASALAGARAAGRDIRSYTRRGAAARPDRPSRTRQSPARSGPDSDPRSSAQPRHGGGEMLGLPGPGRRRSRAEPAVRHRGAPRPEGRRRHRFRASR